MFMLSFDEYIRFKDVLRFKSHSWLLCLCYGISGSHGYGSNHSTKDSMLFDPFINGVADLHYRHRDMRLDVDNMSYEDYMLYDPFINRVADLHDRYQDIRLDVDNMPYEELLSLEERIGEVKTGLTKDVILKSMKQRKHMLFMGISTQVLEPCRVRFISSYYV
nr:hypothetical protein [Tanacetum cinerariifolium]